MGSKSIVFYSNLNDLLEKTKDTVNRMGRWIDFRRDYKTMYPWFMESVWFVFKQLYEKGLVYRGFKVTL